MIIELLSALLTVSFVAWIVWAALCALINTPED